MYFSVIREPPFCGSPLKKKLWTLNRKKMIDSNQHRMKNDTWTNIWTFFVWKIMKCVFSVLFFSTWKINSDDCYQRKKHEMKPLFMSKKHYNCKLFFKNVFLSHCVCFWWLTNIQIWKKKINQQTIKWLMNFVISLLLVHQKIKILLPHSSQRTKLVPQSSSIKPKWTSAIVKVPNGKHYFISFLISYPTKKKKHYL